MHCACVCEAIESMRYGHTEGYYSCRDDWNEIRSVWKGGRRKDPVSFVHHKHMNQRDMGRGWITGQSTGTAGSASTIRQMSSTKPTHRTLSYILHPANSFFPYLRRLRRRRLHSRIPHNIPILPPGLPLPPSLEQLPHLEARERMRLRINDDLIERPHIVGPEEEVEVFQCLSLLTLVSIQTHTSTSENLPARNSPYYPPSPAGSHPHFLTM